MYFELTSAECIMAKKLAFLLSFVQNIPKRQREEEKADDDDQDQESDDSDRHDIQAKDSSEESEHASEHSCHDPSHMMSTLIPKFLVISWPLKNESLNNCIVRCSCVF